MAFNIKLVSHSKLIKHLELNRDISNEIIRRLEIADTIQEEISDLEDKIGGLEMGIQDSINNLKDLI